MNAEGRRRRFGERVAAKSESPRPIRPRAESDQAARPTMTIPEVAWALGVSVEHAYRRAKAGELPGAFKFGRRWVVSREAFNRFLENPLPAPMSAVPPRQSA
jgi:excisionase family DNA binding protein